MHSHHAKVHRPGFGRWLLLLAGIYAVLIAVGAGIFWGYLKRYERNHPVGAMNAYFAQLRQGERDAILADSGFPFNEINTPDVYWRYLEEKYAHGDRRWQYAEVPQTEGKTVYDVYAEDKRYGSLTLDRQPDGWHICSDYTLQTLTVIAAGEPQMNGVDLTAYRTGETTVEIFAGGSGDPPATGTYTVPCLQEGTFTLNGETPLLERDGDITLHLSPAVSEPDRQALTALSEAVARTYAAYISGDAPLSELTAYLESDTDFSRQVKAYSSYYYNKHNSIDFQQLQVSAPAAWSADAFTADVSFDFVVRRTYDSHTYPTRYRIAFRRSGKGFSVCNIQTM